MTVWTEEAIRSKGLRISNPARFREPSDVVAVRLPIPPSANHCWANVAGVGRVRSTSYRRWSKLAMAEIQAQQSGRVAGKFAVVITAKRTKRARDIDNIIKPILDLLSGVVTADDGQCERVSAGWTDQGEDGVLVWVRKAA